MKFRSDMDVDEHGDSGGQSWMDELVHGNENEKSEGNEREGWKVMGFGLAWFWLLTSGT
jgi:hypothetical protein